MLGAEVLRSALTVGAIASGWPAWEPWPSMVVPAFPGGGAPPPAAPPSSSGMPRWLRQWVNACKSNLDSDLARQLAAYQSPADVVTRAKAAAITFRMRVPYRFDQASPASIESLAVCEQRGFGACGDGSAFVAAVALLVGDPRASVRLCYETHPSSRGYAHAAVDVAGIRADPYADASLSVPRCTASIEVRELLGWSVPATPRR